MALNPQSKILTPIENEAHLFGLFLCPKSMLESLKFKIADREINLSEAEARELYQSLHELFGSKIPPVNWSVNANEPPVYDGRPVIIPSVWKTGDNPDEYKPDIRCNFEDFSTA